MELQLRFAFLGASVAIGRGRRHPVDGQRPERGVRRSYRTIFGLEIGLMTQLALVAVGLGAVLAGSALAFAVVPWPGVVRRRRGGAVTGAPDRSGLNPVAGAAADLQLGGLVQPRRRGRK